MLKKLKNPSFMIKIILRQVLLSKVPKCKIKIINLITKISLYLIYPSDQAKPIYKLLR